MASRMSRFWRENSGETGKWAAKMVNDMAFEFKDRFPEVLASRYTIRDKGFIGKTIKVDKARPRSRMEDIAAVIGTWQGKTGKTFSGFEEEITGRRVRRITAETEGNPPRRARGRDDER
jgi:hypothetical protein